jgi:cytoplasmic iron level regulating protein YaaA (DUF328/UPF0246 family)
MVFKPLDLMQAYRLEMGTKLPIGERKICMNLESNNYKALNKVENDELFVNLAVMNIFRLLIQKALKVPVITPDFKDYKDGTKIISFFC